MGNFYMESTQINYRRDDKLKTVDQKLQELSETSAIDTDIAPVFKSTNTYQPGDLVYYRNKLYVFNVEHTGTWAAADVTATDVTTTMNAGLNSLKSGLTNYENQNNLNLEVPDRKNIAAGVVSLEATTQFATVLYVDCNLKPSTTYTLSFDGTEGNQLYTNENIFVQQTTITIGSSRTSVTVTTKSTIPSSEYTEGKGWRFLKNHIEQPNDNTFTDVQLELGSTATAYTPYIPSVESRIEAVESGKANIYIFNLAANATAYIGHNNCTALVYTDRGGMWVDGFAGRDFSEIKESSIITATREDTYNIKLQSLVAYGTVVVIMSEGTIEFGSSPFNYT